MKACEAMVMATSKKFSQHKVWSMQSMSAALKEVEDGKGLLETTRKYNTEYAEE